MKYSGQNRHWCQFLCLHYMRDSICRHHGSKFYPHCLPIVPAIVSQIWKNICPLMTWKSWLDQTKHYNDIIMSTMASQITSLTIVYSTIYSSTAQRKHQSSASLAFARGIHRWPVNSPHKRAGNAGNDSIWWRHHEHNTKPWEYSTLYIRDLIYKHTNLYFQKLIGLK